MNVSRWPCYSSLYIPWRHFLICACHPKRRFSHHTPPAALCSFSVAATLGKKVGPGTLPDAPLEKRSKETTQATRSQGIHLEDRHGHLDLLGDPSPGSSHHPRPPQIRLPHHSMILLDPVKIHGGNPKGQGRSPPFLRRFGTVASAVVDLQKDVQDVVQVVAELAKREDLLSAQSHPP